MSTPPAAKTTATSRFLDSPHWALVTGANRGIGLAVARLLVARGKRVLVAGRSKESSAAAAAAVCGAAPCGAATVEPLVLDVSDPRSIEEAVTKVHAKYGRTVDVLVNNAGICPRGWSEADLQPTLRTNLDGPLLLTRALVESLAPPSGALVVNVSSELGKYSWQDPAYVQALQDAQSLKEVRRVASTFHESEKQGANSPASFSVGTYALSKAALNRSVQLLAKDKRLADVDLSVVACCPGWCRTDMGSAATPEHEPPRSAEQGAESVLWCIEHCEPSLNGGFFRDGERLEW